MSAEFESGVFTEGTPAWHGLGVTLPNDALDAQEALEYSGLAHWGLQKLPVYVAPGDSKKEKASYIEVPDFAAIVRTLDGKPLGIVGSGYSIVSNEDAFDWANALVGGDGFHFKTAGSLYGGARVWVLLKTPFDVALPDSKLEQYLLVWNRHDGHGSVRALLTNVRVVCANTLAMADRGAKNSFNIRHTVNAADKLGEAQRVLGLSQGAADRAEKIALSMLKRKFSERQWAGLLDQIVPVPTDKGAAQTIAQDTHATLDNIYHNHPTQEGITGTAWGAYNAFAAYNDHAVTSHDSKRASAAENRMVRVLDEDNIAGQAFKVLVKA